MSRVEVMRDRMPNMSEWLRVKAGLKARRYAVVWCSDQSMISAARRLSAREASCVLSYFNRSSP